MSAIRLFILGTLAASGPLHGHQIRQQAQADRTERYADVQVGSVYGALKRMAREGLVREVRTERVGNRPERTVYEITGEGYRSLSAIRDEILRKISLPHDPFDLALKLSQDMAGEELSQIVEARLAALRAEELSGRYQAERADPYLNEAERMIVQHLIDRVVTEVRWHEELLSRMPKIAAGFQAGIGAPVTLAQGTSDDGGAGAKGAGPSGDDGAGHDEAGDDGAGIERAGPSGDDGAGDDGAGIEGAGPTGEPGAGGAAGGPATVDAPTGPGQGTR